MKNRETNEPARSAWLCAAFLHLVRIPPETARLCAEGGKDTRLACCPHFVDFPFAVRPESAAVARVAAVLLYFPRGGNKTGADGEIYRKKRKAENHEQQYKT